MPDPSGGLATLAWAIFRDGKTPAEDLTDDELKAKPEDEDQDRKPKKGKT